MQLNIMSGTVAIMKTVILMTIIAIFVALGITADSMYRFFFIISGFKMEFGYVFFVFKLLITKYEKT